MLLLIAEVSYFVMLLCYIYIVCKDPMIITTHTKKQRILDFDLQIV